MTPHSRIYVAGADTLAGRNLIDHLLNQGWENLVGEGDEPDATNAAQVEEFFAVERPEYVVVAAGLSGGILENQRRPADLMTHNLHSTLNLFEASRRHRVKKLLYLGSSCMYPRRALQPMQPAALMTGSLEPTNASYALAKLAGMQLCQAYRQQYRLPFVTAIPANAYGPHDDFHPESAHVIPALMRKMHDAKMRGNSAISIWGTGAPRRDFLFSQDLADACVFLLQNYDGDEPINVGSGADASIADIAYAIAQVVGFRGDLRFDATRPDGAPIKKLDSSPLFAMGWKPKTTLRDGLKQTYASLIDHLSRESRHVRTAV